MSNIQGWDHIGVGYQIAQYLHSVGITHNPDEEQSTTTNDGRVAVFLGWGDDEPDEAVMIQGPWQDDWQDNLTQSNPIVRILVTLRAAGQEQLESLSRRLFHALHRPDHGMRLTASQKVLESRRVLSDAPTLDHNRRWMVTHTYQLRLAVPAS